MVLDAAGVLDGRRATSYPGFLKDAKTATVVGDAVVVDRGVITSRGPGTALDFALTLVAELAGPSVREAIESRLEREKPATA
jgi:4-methyl-5(b-hydroxyethyl)-thiazole monophosphate biosynthesis